MLYAEQSCVQATQCSKYHTDQSKQLYAGFPLVVYLLILLTRVRPRPKLLHACTPLFRRLFVADVSSVLELLCLYVGVLGLVQPLGGIVACGRAEAKTGWGRSWTSSTFLRRRATDDNPQMYFLFMWPCPATGQSLVPGRSKPARCR